ncbi:general transcription factor [Lithospermum erythrorhizon]|uniref:General transcription factor n=1 Tax=Lithospermum erythrorhizon TaxID=34254 RepID=A0AAV3P8U2_LITER
MDMGSFRMILSRAKGDIWAVIETAIGVAAADYGDELKSKRDKIVQLLYSSSSPQLCNNCHNDVVCDDGRKICSDVEIDDDDVDADKKNNIDLINNCDNSIDRVFDDDVNFSKSPLTPESNDGNGNLDPFGGLFDDEQTEILSIKDRLVDSDQDEESVVGLLQSLANMDITFQALQETDIGRHVNKFRKHPSNEVRRLVKQLVRKWKETVDEWVRLNDPEKASSNLIDEDSPQQLQTVSKQNGHPQVLDFGHSPNPHHGGSSSDKHHSIPEYKPKTVQPSRGTPSRPLQSAPKAASATPPTRPPKDDSIDARLNSARRRLHENYQEAQNAKKQRTIQVMDIHEIPKPKNSYFPKNKGGFQRNHR